MSSPQPSPIGRFSPAVTGSEDLVFGNDPQSSVAIPKTLMAQIWEQVAEGIQRLSRGGLEVGGLLVGPKVRGGGVVVDGIIPLPIEYRHGPSFRMSTSDLINIAPAIESVQSDLSKAVVGVLSQPNSRGRQASRKRLRNLKRNRRSPRFFCSGLSLLFRSCTDVGIRGVSLRCNA